MERHVEGIYRTMRSRKSRTFNQLIGEDASAEVVVVTFMAILELYKRGIISIHQDFAFEDIVLQMEDDAPEITDFSVPDWGMPEDESLSIYEAGEDEEEPVEEMADEDTADEDAAGEDTADTQPQQTEGTE